MKYTPKLKELAKELCEKSGCHHKCNDTKDCVVEDEALLLINDNKSNNFDVKSNNLPSTLTNEDKVSVKDRKIEEMAKVIDYTFVMADGVGATRPSSRMIAMDLYDAGYRKQSEGEWTYDYTGEELLGTDAVYQYKCSLCGEHSIVPWRYCPDCGAKMKGGEE